MRCGGTDAAADSSAIPKRPYNAATEAARPAGRPAGEQDLRWLPSATVCTFVHRTSAGRRCRICTARGRTKRTAECMHLAAPNWKDDDARPGAEQNWRRDARCRDRCHERKKREDESEGHEEVPRKIGRREPFYAAAAAAAAAAASAVGRRATAALS